MPKSHEATLVGGHPGQKHVRGLRSRLRQDARRDGGGASRQGRSEPLPRASEDVGLAPYSAIASQLTRTLLALLLFALAACDELRFPADPNNTLDTVLATKKMTVAAVDHSPWVKVSDDGPPSGAEVALIEEFARDLGVSITWRRMPASAAFEALKQGEADLAIGGLIEKDVSAHDAAAPTYGYFHEALIVAARQGSEVPRELEGRRVFVPSDVIAAKLIREKGGIPLEDQAEADLVALPHWQVSGHDLVPTGIVLQRSKHVLAVPKGENAWVMRIERFLRKRSGDMGASLRDYAR